MIGRRGHGCFAVLLVILFGSGAGPERAWAGTVERIDVARFEGLVEEGVTIVDIRRADEWRSTGIIPGSRLITAYDETGRLVDGFVPQLRDLAAAGKPLALICRSGNRSAAAARLLAAELPAVTIFDVAGGVRDWQATGHALSPCLHC